MGYWEERMAERTHSSRKSPSQMRVSEWNSFYFPGSRRIWDIRCSDDETVLSIKVMTWQVFSSLLTTPCTDSRKATLIRVPVTFCCSTNYPKTWHSKKKKNDNLYFAIRAGLGRNSASLVHSHQLGQLEAHVSDSWCWLSAVTSAGATAGAPHAAWPSASWLPPNMAAVFVIQKSQDNRAEALWHSVP